MSAPRILLPIFGLFVLLLALPVHAAECIRGPYLQDAAVGAVTIRWELDRLGSSAVEYWTGSEARQRVNCPFRGRKHKVRLTKLQPGRRYQYRVLSEENVVGDEMSFRATPDDDSEQTFAVFGDFGARTKGQLRVAKLLEGTAAEFVLLTGDLIYGRGEEEHYDLRFFEPYRYSLPKMVFWPALGNHDVGSKDGAAALAAFDVPLNGPAGLQGGRNYSFDSGAAHIAAIDSNARPETLRTVIGPWLEKDMAASKKRWKFVFFHHPPFSSANHGENANIRSILVPVFIRAKIDIVFAGHDHSYERTKAIDGVVYVVSGNGGNTLYQHKNPHGYTARFYNDKHGLTLVTLNGPRLLLRHVNVDGDEIDRLELSK
jgi:hypothetical protein